MPFHLVACCRFAPRVTTFWTTALPVLRVTLALVGCAVGMLPSSSLAGTSAIGIPPEQALMSKAGATMSANRQAKRCDKQRGEKEVMAKLVAA